MVANNWRTRLPEELFSIPRYGTLNLHDSLLPRFTGFSPVIWSLISGATHTGLTAHLMDDELDTGDILVQRSVEITPTSTGTSLVFDTLDLVPDVLEEALDGLEFGTATPVAQDLSQRTFFHKRSDRDSLVDWTWPAADIERLVRALSDPYPNAYTYFRGERLRLIRSHVSRCTYGGTPGRVFIEEDGGMVIVAGADAYPRSVARAGARCGAHRRRRRPLRAGLLRPRWRVSHARAVMCGEARGTISGVPVCGSSMIWHLRP